MKKIEELHINAIKYNGWDNGTSVCFYNKDVEGYEGELEDAGKASAEITKDITIRFDKWKRYFLKTTKDDYDLYLLPENPMGRWYTVEELFEEFLKTL